MAGAGEIVVLDPAKYRLEEAQANQIKAHMLQESLGTLSKTLIDAASTYQENKDKDQKRQLAAITTAGALSGGMDRLPQDVKNKLPGVIGFDLPRDDQGNVQITPDIQTVVHRAAMDAISKDPSLALVYTGAQEKRTDPSHIQSQIDLERMKQAGDNERAARASADRAAQNDTSIKVATIEANASIAGALARAHTEQEKAQVLDSPSPFVLDAKTGIPMTVPQFHTTYPGAAEPPVLSYRHLNSITNANKVMAQTDSSRASAAANYARANKMQGDLLRAAMDPDPNNIEGKRIKNLMDLAKTAAGVQGTSAGDSANALLDKEMHDMLISKGYGEDDIAALKTMGGSFTNILSNWWHTINGTTAVHAQDTAGSAGKNPTAPPATTNTPTSGAVLDEQKSREFLFGGGK